MNIRRVVLASLLSLISLIAAASWREAVPQARLIGEGQLRFFGLRIYDARLWSETAPLQARTPFALELTYHRRFYVNGRLQHEVADAAFADAFFAIWLDPRSRDQKLRRNLLGQR